MPYQYTQPPIIQQASKAPATPDPNAMMMMLMEWFKNGQNIKLAREQLASEERRSADLIASADKRQGMADNAALERVEATGAQNRETLAYEYGLRRQVVQEQNLQETMSLASQVFAMEAQGLANTGEILKLQEGLRQMVGHASKISDYLKSVIGLDQAEQTVEKIGELGMGKEGTGSSASTTPPPDGGIPRVALGNKAIQLSDHFEATGQQNDAVIGLARQRAQRWIQMFQEGEMKGTLPEDPGKAIRTILFDDPTLNGQGIVIVDVFPAMDGRPRTDFSDEQEAVHMQTLGGDLGAASMRLSLEMFADGVDTLTLGPGGEPNRFGARTAETLRAMSSNLYVALPATANMEHVLSMRGVHDMMGQPSGDDPINTNALAMWQWAVVQADPEGTLRMIDEERVKLGLAPWTPADKLYQQNLLDQAWQRYLQNNPQVAEGIQRIESVAAKAKVARQADPVVFQAFDEYTKQELSMHDYTSKHSKLEILRGLHNSMQLNGASEEQLANLRQNMSNLAADMFQSATEAPSPLLSDEEMPQEFDPINGRIPFVSSKKNYQLISELRIKAVELENEAKAKVDKADNELKQRNVAKSLLGNNPGMQKGAPTYGPSVPGDTPVYGPTVGGKNTPMSILIKGSSRDVGHLLPWGSATPTSGSSMPEPGVLDVNTAGAPDGAGVPVSREAGDLPAEWGASSQY